jgi:hypothetical protein
VLAVFQVRSTQKVEGTMLSVITSLSEAREKRRQTTELGSRKKCCSQKLKRTMERAMRLRLHSSVFS